MPEYLAKGLSAASNREIGANCVDQHLKEIEIELSESLNSAMNLADKIKTNTTPPQGQGAVQPTSSDVNSRLLQILNTVRWLNQELGRAHNAISG